MKDLLLPLKERDVKIGFTSSQQNLANMFIKGRTNFIAGYSNSLEYFIKNSPYVKKGFKYKVIPLGKRMETFFCYNRNRKNAQEELNNIQSMWSNLPEKLLKTVSKKYNFKLDITSAK
jgi:hypothetical protein